MINFEITIITGIFQINWEMTLTYRNKQETACKVGKASRLTFFRSIRGSEPSPMPP